MIAKYSHGTPNDWMERNIYSKYSSKGIILTFLIDLFLFGVPGISIWAIQMMWIPLWAAGVINGIGHAWGYRNFECLDGARNIIPWGFWIGGEELHNNHHTFASSAKFSLKWWEFDLGWFYIRLLSFLGLAKVKKLPPRLTYAKNKAQVDLDTVKAVVGHRFQVLSHYYTQVVKPMVKELKAEGFKVYIRSSRKIKKKDKKVWNKLQNAGLNDDALVNICAIDVTPEVFQLPIF
jgi:stearoyl-CoA desaturase (delta-9 desaturase)